MRRLDRTSFTIVVVIVVFAVGVMNTVPTKRAYFCHFQHLQQTATENNRSVYIIDKFAQINIWLTVNL